jgi:hypothetical protein
MPFNPNFYPPMVDQVEGWRELIKSTEKKHPLTLSPRGERGFE